MRCRPWLSNKRGSRAIYGGIALLTPHRRGTAMTAFLEPFASVYDDRSRLGVILARGRGGFEAYAPTITAWDCFRARARPLPRSPRRARGPHKRPPKTSANGANNDCPRLRCRRRLSLRSTSIPPRRSAWPSRPCSSPPRGDRITMRFAAVHESSFGTKQTCRHSVLFVRFRGDCIAKLFLSVRARG